jgi:ribulose-phosphate 3-epimerase
MIEIYPSLISADLLNLHSVIMHLEPHCDGFHIDIMDNHFVPNLTWGVQFFNAIAKITKKPLWIHLMIENVESFIPNLMLKSNDILSFHIEEEKNIEKIINLIKEKKSKVQLAIQPKTDLNKIFSFLEMVDSILLMSVNPGFSGQQFLPDSIDRLKQLNQYRLSHNLRFSIAMDGGICKSNIGLLVQHGCNVVAVASGIFSCDDHIKALKDLYRAAVSIA